MEGSISTTNNGKKGTPKKFIILIVTAILIVGGSVAAFVLLNFSDKQKYFLAEKNTFDELGEQIENRYEQELSWHEKVQENPTDSTFELSANYNNPAAEFNMFGPAQIINNSTLTLKNSMDLDEKKMATEISGAFGGITIDGLNFYLTSEKFLVELPFLKELLQINEGDIGKLLQEIDPEMYSGKEQVDFDSFFKGSHVLPEDDQEYLKEEYLEMVYDSLPDDAFQASDETVEVNSESLNAEKIEFHMNESQLKELLSLTMEKMKDDKRLKEIIREQLALQSLGAGVPASGLAVNSDIDEMINEFETTLDNGINGLKTFQIPDGLTSTIWINDDLIIKRDFALTMGPSNDELVSLKVNGTQLVKDTTQTFDYTIGAVENQNESTLKLTGDLSWDNSIAKDSIKLSAEDLEVEYNGNSTLEDGTRDFERIFTMKTGQDQGSLNWSGNATYNEDEMSSEHTFAVQASGMLEDTISLHVAKDAKLVKEVTIPSDQDVKDIGSMTIDEMMEYFELEVTPKFQQWVMGIMGSGGGFN